MYTFLDMIPLLSHICLSALHASISLYSKTTDTRMAAAAEAETA